MIQIFIKDVIQCNDRLRKPIITDRTPLINKFSICNWHYHNLFHHLVSFFHPTKMGNNTSTPDSTWTSCVCPVTRRVKILFAAAIFKYLRIRKSHGRLGIANTKLMGQVWSGHLGAAPAIKKTFVGDEAQIHIQDFLRRFEMYTNWLLIV